jgi:hypothetical protein
LGKILPFCWNQPPIVSEVSKIMDLVAVFDDLILILQAESGDEINSAPALSQTVG